MRTIEPQNRRPLTPVVTRDERHEEELKQTNKQNLAGTFIIQSNGSVTPELGAQIGRALGAWLNAKQGRTKERLDG